MRGSKNCSKDLQKFSREKEKNSWISTVYEFYVLLFRYYKKYFFMLSLALMPSVVLSQKDGRSKRIPHVEIRRHLSDRAGKKITILMESSKS